MLYYDMIWYISYCHKQGEGEVGKLISMVTKPDMAMAGLEVKLFGFFNPGAHLL